jgi:hypothetical protein
MILTTFSAFSPSKGIVRQPTSPRLALGQEQLVSANLVGYLRLLSQNLHHHPSTRGQTDIKSEPLYSMSMT